MKPSTYILLTVTLTLALPLGAQVSMATDDPAVEGTSRSFALSTGSRMRAPIGAGEVVLVIPARGMSAETLAELRKDMHIMCQIFDRRLEAANLRPADRPRMFAPSDGRTRGLYLPGFGPVFLLQADFPLLSGQKRRSHRWRNQAMPSGLRSNSKWRVSRHPAAPVVRPPSTTR